MAIKTITFNYTGAVQVWSPPNGVTRIKIECFGAQGGDMIISPWTGKGGKGGYTWGEVILNDIQTLYIYVGGQGQGYNGSSNHPGGWNGGGTCYGGASGGGGASDVRTVLDDLNSRIIVAGGGGGSNDHTNGGDGGGLNGNAGQTSGAIAGGGGTQTSGGTGWINGSFGIGGGVFNSYSDGGAGGGGWYGGGKAQGYDSAGGGGSSYYGALLNAGTMTGVNSGHGLVKITYEEINYAVFLKKDNKYYMPIAKYFDVNNQVFIPVTLSDVINQIDDDGSLVNLIAMNNSFFIEHKMYKPFELIDLTKYQFCIIPMNNKLIDNINLSYIPSEVALLKSNIKVKEKFVLNNYKLNVNDTIFFFDIKATDKTKMDYFFDYGETKSYKNCSILNTDKIGNDFYINFKLNSADSLLQSVTLYGKNNDKYVKLKEPSINIYDKFIRFNESYNEVIINELCKQSVVYTINTLDKF